MKDHETVRIILHINNQVVTERMRQDGICGGPDHDDRNDDRDWIYALSRQLGLAAQETTLEEADLARWERQMVRIIATARAALESFYRKHPERVGKVAGQHTPGPGY